MAVGLGKLFGFTIMENFNLPYMATSVRDFWRRWHVSLSIWFRDYLYIPLGGNRKGNLRTYANLAIVFLLTGLWHGAGLNFIFWGIFHGTFLILERIFLGKALEKNRLKWINHIYALLVVTIGWVFFRAASLSAAFQFVGIMLTGGSGGAQNSILEMVGKRQLVMLIPAVLFSGVLQKMFEDLSQKCRAEPWQKAGKVLYIAGMAAIFGYSLLLMVCNTYNAFIYFQF
jgi:alginate O-acetyltransferase complex protein AlgI